MIFLNRFIGSWLDTNFHGDKEEIMTRAASPMTSPIAAAMRRSDLYFALEHAIFTGNYAYAVPHEVNIADMEDDLYYRYEVINASRYIGDSNVCYGRGQQLKKHYKEFDELSLILGNAKVTVYVYDDFNAMLSDMSDECYVKDSGVNLVLTDSNLSYAKWVDGVFLRESEVRDIYMPILEDDC